MDSRATNDMGTEQIVPEGVDAVTLGRPAPVAVKLNRHLKRAIVGAMRRAKRQAARKRARAAKRG